MLRTMKVGGTKVTITFTGGGCSVSAQHMQEIGAGEFTTRSVFGGDSVIHRAIPVFSSCRFGG